MMYGLKMIKQGGLFILSAASVSSLMVVSPYEVLSEAMSRKTITQFYKSGWEEIEVLVQKASMVL